MRLLAAIQLHRDTQSEEADMTLDQVKELVAGKELEFFLCSFVEMSGAPKAKLVPATHLEDMAEEGAGFAGFAAGNMGQGPHDPDMANIPDFDSLTVVPTSGSRSRSINEPSCSAPLDSPSP